MNIQVQICGMIILIVLAVFFKSNKTLHLHTENIFLRVMIFAIASLSLDILSLVAIEYRHGLPMFLVEFVCKTYVISLIWVGMSGTIYVLADILTEETLKKIINRMILLTCVQGLIVYALPIYIYDNLDQVYTYGPAVMCVYVFAVLYVIATVVILVVFKNKVSRRREFAVGLWMLIWLIAAVIQFLNNELLLVGFATAVGVLILFVILENPESTIDRRLGCFNSYALTEYIKELQKRKNQFGILVLSFGNANLMEEHRGYAEELLRGVVNTVNRQNKVLAFKNARQGLLFIGNDGDILYRVGLDILEFLSKEGDWYKETRLALVRKGEIFKNTEELFSFLSFLQREYTNEKERVFPVGEAIIERYRQRFVMEQKIAEALQEDRVEVYLQPVYNAEENKFTSAEALVRIREKNGDLIPPGLFIPVAESSGQILELGERVFEKVCEFLRKREAIDLGIRYIEVNLSVIQCERKDLAERLITILERYAVSPSNINFEITETASISARATLLANMRRLIDYGFGFSLDDFGKGQSNLMYVVEMPVSTIKLDIDMVKAFFKTSKAKLVVWAVVGMAHGMGIKLVAEGVETKEEMEAMCREGVDFIQGYYYSRPLPMTEFLEFIRQKQETE